jgi:hypothetical protein
MPRHLPGHRHLLGRLRTTEIWVRQAPRSDADRTAEKLAAAFTGAVADLAWKAPQASDRRYYGVPFSSQSFALPIRKDRREKVGLPAPRTWAGLAKPAKAFTEDDPDDTTVTHEVFEKGQDGSGPCRSLCAHCRRTTRQASGCCSVPGLPAAVHARADQVDFRRITRLASWTY